MRAFLVLVSFSLAAHVIEAQTLLLQENFTTYAGTSATVPAGWYFSYNGNYTSASFSGASGPNAYKFGATNAAIITPAFANADSVLFWIKGASTDTASYLSVYETSDSITWTLISKIKPLPTTGTNYTLQVLPSSIHLKFVFTKSAGNLAFDDLNLWRSGSPPVSVSSGKITIYFNNPVNAAVSSGVPAVYLNRLIDDTLIAYINRAKYKIDAAIYNFIQDTSVSDIAGAINNAYARGVKIRWINDGSTSNTALPLLNAGIQRLASPTTSAYTIMHNKFFVIDGNSADPNDPIVWTGSTNITPQQMNYDVNNAIIIQDKNLANAYTAEFNEMWGDTGLVPNAVNSKFGQYKTDNTPHIFNIGGRTVEQYFSPSDNVNDHILQAISTANTEMYFGMFTFTVAADADSIRNKIQNQNVYTAGIMDQNSQPHPPYDSLSPLMGNLLKIYTNGALVYHNKMLIADACDIFSDPLVLTGSHNWTASANTKNDENTLIIHDDTVANIYYQSFYRNFTDLGGTLAPCAVTAMNETVTDDILISPNPSEGKFSIQSERFKVQGVELFNLLGVKIISMSPSLRGSGGGFVIDLSGIDSGIYFLRIKTDKETFTRKVVFR